MTNAAGRYDLTPEDYRELLGGAPAYRVDQIWQGLYADMVDWADLTTLPADLRARLSESAPAGLRLVTKSVSADPAPGGGDATLDTVKWLWALADNHQIETVLMHYRDRATVCVSTQAGCAMGCGFCATGQAGFDRNLTSGEIVEQVIRARSQALPDRLSNVVFMGMGEPLANFEAVWTAVERIHTDIGLSARNLTISTVGMVPGIRKLAAAPLPVSLAVSLHAANDSLRDELVPINRRYPLEALKEACREHRQARNRRLSLEWAMIDGVNDRDRDADELAGIAIDLRAHVNLIPLNPTPGYPTVGTPPKRITAFARQLDDAGVNVTVRRNRGTAIDAACGQLAASHANGNEAGSVDVAIRSGPSETTD